MYNANECRKHNLTELVKLLKQKQQIAKSK